MSPRRFASGAVALVLVLAGCGDSPTKPARVAEVSIAVPPLGCGNGGLDWADVRPRIVEAFEAIPDVRVLLFEPSGAPPPEAIVDRGKSPNRRPGAVRSSR